MTKTNKELAIEMTMAVVEARAKVVASIDGNNTAIQNQLESLFSDNAIVNTFEEIYKTVVEKEY